MLVITYDSTLCKNTVMLFESFEWINLMFILVQHDGLYSNHILACSLALELSHACSAPCQTLKSRRVGPLDDSKCLQSCPFLSVQTCSFAKLALTSFCI